MLGLAFLFTLGFVMTKKMDFSWLSHLQYVNQQDAAHGSAHPVCRDLGLGEVSAVLCVGVYSSLCACGLCYTSAAGQHSTPHVPSRSLALLGLSQIIFHLEMRASRRGGAARPLTSVGFTSGCGEILEAMGLFASSVVFAPRFLSQQIVPKSRDGFRTGFSLLFT